jgi:serine/threonine protein phosphatase PrpC
MAGVRSGPMSSLALECAARNDIGRRANNEDAVFVSSKLAAVADGVGGAAAGEVASQRIVESLALLDKSRLEIPLDAALEGAIAWANESIGFIAGCRPQLAGMSSTLTAVALSNEGDYVIANIGDSRTYLLRDGELTQLSRDDSLVQDLVEAGHLTAEQARKHPARNVVSHALDGDPERRATTQLLQARDGDRLLLCSDGLSDVIEHTQLREVLSACADRDDCADQLIHLALEGGTRDNVSAIVVDVVPRTDPETAWRPALAHNA